MTSGDATRVFFPCTGLGRESRGFEAFTRECATALNKRSETRITVFGGGGEMRPGERTVLNFPRDSMAARALGALLDASPYFVEQSTFFAGFVLSLAMQRPDVVYFGDLNLGNACWHWRRLTGQRYRLLYYNGGATTMPFTRCDAVQQVSPEHLDSAIARGEARSRMLLLPHGLTIAPKYSPIRREERQRTRAELGVPADAPLVLSAGALGLTDKRLDYVLSEVATMPSAPHLLLLGAETSETRQLREIASDRMGDRCTIRTLPREKMRDAYRAADAFVLASLREGFGLAMVEALEAGLPCVAHETPTTAYVLGDVALRGRLDRAGVLAPLLERALAMGRAAAAERHAHAYRKFSWDILAPRYARMFRNCAAGKPLQDGDEPR